MSALRDAAGGCMKSQYYVTILLSIIDKVDMAGYCVMHTVLRRLEECLQHFVIHIL